MINQGTGGYQCPVCYVWVPIGVTHYCGGIPSSTPGCTPFTAGCRAPWAPLTAESVRLIIREELERLQLGKCPRCIND